MLIQTDVGVASFNSWTGVFSIRFYIIQITHPKNVYLSPDAIFIKLDTKTGLLFCIFSFGLEEPEQTD